MKKSAPEDLLNPSKTSLASMASALIMFMMTKKFKEAVDFAEKAMIDFSADPDRSAYELSIARFLVISSMQGCYATIKAESEETARLWRTKQLKWLLEDTNSLKLQQSTEMLLLHVSMLCWVVKDIIDFYPEQREKLVAYMVKYFYDTDRACYNVRHSLKGDDGLSQLLRKRTLVSKFNIRNFYEAAAEFFLQVRDETNAWYWLQRKRGQVLLDMLAERATAYDQLESTFKKDKTIGELISKEDSLVEKVEQTDADQYLSASENLTEHRAKMKSVPALTGLLDDSTFSNPQAWNNLDDIWSMAEWLPENTNIVLIDWFVAPRNVVFWMSKDLKRKHLTPEWSQLRIGTRYIDNWIAKYLQFPIHRSKPLEQPRAVWKLQYLLSGLEKICKPGDLVILTPPARFASVPIHAIPMENQPWISRNPILYSSSFSLYRECLKRSRRPSLALQNAIFTAAYEEPGFEEEKLNVMKQVQSSAAMFGGQSIMGANLTSDALRNALISAPWIHYHGHAYYERTEALKQCFVLSPGSRHEEDSRSGAAVEPDEVTGGGAEPIAEIESAVEGISIEPPPLPEALLSAHLLNNSSQLAVSDIFTLNLSKNHPFVCSIACDSGLEDVAAGDESLGLVTALFCAGASSVLGTLWPIRSSTGRRFTKFFYESIERQRRVEEERDSKVKVLNLVAAVREASLEVKKEMGDPYSWAAFTLHGAGFYFYEL